MPDRPEPSLEEILSAGALDSDSPDLESILNPDAGEADPLAKVDYTGSVGEDAVREAEALRTGFKDRAKKEQKRFKDATSTEYYSVVCFQTEEQKDALLNILDIPRSGRTHFQKYIPAHLFVAAINRLVESGRTIELPDSDIVYRETGSDRKLDRLT